MVAEEMKMEAFGDRTVEACEDALAGLVSQSRPDLRQPRRLLACWY